MRRLISFARWSRDAGWSDTLYVLIYPLKTWRCQIFGHDWGPEDRDYEPNTGCMLQAWQDCQRPGCDGWRETFHYTSGHAHV